MAPSMLADPILLFNYQRKGKAIKEARDVAPWHSVCLTCVNLQTQFLTLETSISHKIELHGTEFIHSGNVSLPRVDQRKTLSLLLCTLGCRTEKPDALHKNVKTDPWRETHGKEHEVSQQLAPASEERATPSSDCNREMF